MITRRFAAVGLMAAIATPRAFAYQSRQVSVIVPFAPGASADGVSRLVASYLGPKLGSTVIVENRPGGGGVTGLQFVSRSGPDGQTLGIGATGAIVINPNVPGATTFNPLGELTPIAKLVDIPIVFVSNPKAGLNDIQSVVNRSKQLANGLSFGTTGANTTQHLAIELLKRRTGANLVHIPYKGSAPAVTDVLSGEIPLGCVDLTSAAGHIKAGTLKAIGVTSASRYSLAPDIPTFAEQGVTGYELPAWLGMFAPLKLSQENVAELSSALSACMADQHTAEASRALSCSPSYLGAPAFKDFIVAQSGNIRELVGSKSK